MGLISRLFNAHAPRSLTLRLGLPLAMSAVGLAACGGTRKTDAPTQKEPAFIVQSASPSPSPAPVTSPSSVISSPAASPSSAAPSPSPTKSVSAPAPSPAAPAVTTPVTEPTNAVYYANCDAVRAAGAAPLQTGDPGYRSGLDRDHDGIACE